MPEYTEETRDKLAEALVKTWDLEELVSYAILQLSRYYEGNEKGFQEDWAYIIEGNEE